MKLVKILQKTERQSATLFEKDSGELVVEKKIFRRTRETDIEINYLMQNKDFDFQFLKIPQVLDVQSDSLLLSFVDREEYTRDTIVDRCWTDADVARFCQGVLEFQKTDVKKKWFANQKRWFGKWFVQLKGMQLFRKAASQLNLNSKEKREYLKILFRYTCDCFRVRFVPTHYDLNTLNYTFTPSGLMSMLDFELAYYHGDPLYDVIYFCTIPPVRLAEWTFQKKIIDHFLQLTRKSPSNFRRAKCILLVCSVMRFFHFQETDWQRDEYRSTIETILNQQDYDREMNFDK